MLLQGLLRCESCGRPMKIQWTYKQNVGRYYYFYRCTTHTEDPDRLACRKGDRKAGTSVYVNADEAEGEVWRLVDEMLSRPEVLTEAIGTSLAEQRAQEPQVEASLQRQERRLAKANQAWAVARRTYYEGNVDADTHANDKEHYEREIQMLTDEIQRMRDASELRARQQATAEDIQEMATRWSAIRDALTAEERREIVWTLVEDVTISPEDEVTVTGGLGDLEGRTNEVLAPRRGLEPRT